MNENMGGFSAEAVASLGGRLNDWFEEHGSGSLMIGTIEVESIAVFSSSHPGNPEHSKFGWYRVYFSADGTDAKCSKRTGSLDCNFGLDGMTENVVDLTVFD